MNETQQIINFLLGSCEAKNKAIADLIKELETLKAAACEAKNKAIADLIKELETLKAQAPPEAK